MATLTATSIELPSNLLAEAKQYAQQENRPVEALIQDALLQYMEVPPHVHARSRRFQEEATALGLTPDEYSVRLVKEARAELRAERLAS
jgi:predicted transcriptional regulator